MQETGTAATISAHVEPQDPVVIHLLEKTDALTDIEDAIDVTLETVVRTREEARASEQSHWIAENRAREFFHPIYSAGLRRGRPPYTYLRYNLKEQFYDKRKMLIEALWLGIPALQGGSDVDNLSARPNFGTVPVPSVFPGVEVEVFTDVMPWVRKHLTKNEVRREAEDYDSSDLGSRGILPVALEHTRYYRERLAGLDIGIGDVNNQAPIDIAHQIRGEDIFYDMYDDPEFVHELMELSTRAYLDVFDLVEATAGRTDRTNMPYCDDTSVLLSEPLFVEFSLPYLYKVGEHRETVGVHYCGKGHLDHHYFQCPAVKSINLGQPKFFDSRSYMDRIVSAGKVYAGSWPTLSDEETAEEFFRRMLEPLERGKESMQLSIAGFEFGMESAQLCRLWYELQGAR